MMIHRLILIVLLMYLAGCKENQNPGYIKTKKKIPDKETTRHYNILKSLVIANPGDTLFVGGSGSIWYLENASKIEGSADGTTFGKLHFSRSDWIKWDQWYQNTFKQEEEMKK